MLELAFLVLTVLGFALDDIKMKQSKALRAGMTDLAKRIASKIADNQNAINKLYTAYQTKQSSLINSLFTSAGFGARVNSIMRKMDEEGSNFSNKRDKLEKESKDLQAESQAQARAESNLGTIIGNKEGAQYLKDQGYAGVDQAMNGGLKVPDVLPSGVKPGLTNERKWY